MVIGAKWRKFAAQVRRERGQVKRASRQERKGNHRCHAFGGTKKKDSTGNLSNRRKESGQCECRRVQRAQKGQSALMRRENLANFMIQAIFGRGSVLQRGKTGNAKRKGGKCKVEG